MLSDETNSYIYGPGNLPIEQITGTTPLYIHHDQQGSTRVLTNSTGEIAGQITYGPYGNIKETTGSKTPLEYDGQYTDNETGFVYLRARVYDPATAAFTSIDPELIATGAPYSYVNDDPESHTDLNGRRCGDPTPLMLPPVNIVARSESGFAFQLSLLTTVATVGTLSLTTNATSWLLNTATAAPPHPTGGPDWGKVLQACVEGAGLAAGRAAYLAAVTLQPELEVGAVLGACGADAGLELWKQIGWHPTFFDTIDKGSNAWDWYEFGAKLIQH